MWKRRFNRFFKPGIVVFATMDALDSMARASLVTVLPLLALDVFGDSRDVSLAYTLGGVAGLLALFTIPWLTRRFRRRFVYTLGVLLVIAGAVAMATASQVGVTAAIFLRTFAASCVIVMMNLYVMEFIRRRDFVRLEPIRLVAVAVPWTAGPYLGVWLYQEVSPFAAYGLSAACATLVLAYFWSLPLRGGAGANRPPQAPWRHVLRYAAQPRLRLAWLLAFGRSSWWGMFFIYAPLYMVESGASQTTGALLVSIGNAALLIAPLFGWLARRYGLRRVVRLAFLVLGVLTVAVGAAPSPLAGGALLVAGAVGAVCLDGLVIVTFYRAVHAYERAEMATVYSTWRDISNLAMPALAAVLLSFGPLSWVFVAMGASMFVYAWSSRYIPRRM